MPTQYFVWLCYGALPTSADFNMQPLCTAYAVI